MTQSDKTVYSRKYTRFHRSKVKQWQPVVKRALDEQLRYFAATGDVNTIPVDPMLRTLNALHTNVGRLWAYEAWRSVMQQARQRKGVIVSRETKRAPIGLNQEFINALIDYFRTEGLNQAVRITETTKEFIREQLARYAQEQLSLDEVVQLILQSGITKSRATNIARTESTIASNIGESIGVEATGLQTNKIWMAINDHRTRRHHIEVDNQVRPSGKPFDVDGYQMQRPGSSNSDDGRKIPARLICQCRCIVGREVLYGKDGLPLLRSDFTRT